MGEMVIPEPAVLRDVIDYEFSFANGMRLPITVDVGLGDSVDEKEEGILTISLVAKPSAVDPDVMLSEETITIFKKQLSAVIFRKRKQLVSSPEERLEMKRLIHQMAKSIN